MDSEVRQKFEAFAKLEIGKYPSLYDLPDPFKIGPEDEYFEDAVAFALAAWRAGEIARWIPVETPPTKEDEYFVNAEYGVEAADWEEGKWFTVRTYGCDHDARQLFNVTHWQPLPAAPEEKKS